MSNRIDRRRFLANGAAVVGMAIGVRSESKAEFQAIPGSGQRQRMNLSDPMATGTIQKYKTAVTKMLALQPSDPRNWYRNAFIHLLDCPHGNWWLLPWHRGYLGWFEQTCQELIEDSDFALPYWDWTAEPYIPLAFAEDDVLNPANSAFAAGFDAFKAKLSDAVNEFYRTLTAAQREQLNSREMGTPDAFWSVAAGEFPDDNPARHPNFDDKTASAVSLPSLLHALSPRSFEEFGSKKQENHSSQNQSPGFLEYIPHNNVHNSIQSYMGGMLSPIDPLFFMHHSNIDRLWDVWTRRQQAVHLPALPEDADLATWQNEPFLFYVGRDGKPILDGKAGDYTTTTRFGYVYQHGSGEQVATQGVSPLLARRQFGATLSRHNVDSRESIQGTATVPDELTHPSVQGGTHSVFARIKVEAPKNTRGARLEVLVNAPPGAKSVDSSDPSFAGSFAFFGLHNHGNMASTVTFDIPLTDALRKLRAAGKLKKGEPLSIQVLLEGPNIAPATPPIPIQSLTIHSG